MSNIKEIVTLEGERSEPFHYGRVHLFHEGSFLRAYEWSAWLLCHFVHEFKVTRRQFKGIDQPVTFVGFPKTSLPKFVPEGSEVQELGEKHTAVDLPVELTGEMLDSLKEEYEEWRKALPLSVPAREKPQAEDRSPLPTSMTEVMRSILSFPVEKKSPIDCMLFLTEVKEQLATLV